MSYSENLKEVVKSKREEQAQLRKDQIALAQVEEKKAEAQQKADLERERMTIDANKAEAEIRQSDKQSQKLESETLGNIIEQATGGGETKYGKYGTPIKSAGKGQAKEHPATNVFADLDKTTPSEDQIQADRGSQQVPVVPDDSAPAGSESVPVSIADDAQAPTPPSFSPVVSSGKYQKSLEKHLSSMPGYHKRQARLLKEQQAQFNERQKELIGIQKRLDTANDKTIAKMDTLQKNFKLLKENAPARGQIMSDIHWSVKIASALHAGLQGYLVGAGVQDKIVSVLDQLVEREYQDQVTKWESQKDALSDEMNLLQWNYSVTKDGLSAKQALSSQLWEMTGEKLMAELKSIDMSRKSEKEKLEIAGLIESIRMQKEKAWNDAKQQTFENEMSVYKARPTGGKGLADLLKIRKDQREQTKFDLKHGYEFRAPGGPAKSYVLDEKRKQKINEGFVGAEKVISAADQIEKITASLSAKDWAVSKFALWGNKTAKEAQAKFKALGVLLTQYKMNIRKDVAGGQVAVAEHVMMDKLLDLFENQRFSKIKTIVSKFKGNYKTITTLLRRRAVTGATAELLESKVGRDYIRKYGQKEGRRRLFIATGRKMGLKNSELRESSFYLGKGT